MEHTVKTIIEVISTVLAELGDIVAEYPDKSTFNSTEKRLVRWKERTQKKLGQYLNDKEINKFDIASKLDENSSNISYRFSLYNRQVKYYFNELIDDLKSFPQSVVIESEKIDISVFVSYAWANKKTVSAIDQWLRNKGMKTKIDERDFFAGERIRDEIIRVMTTCQVILIFHSEQSKDKPWIEFERKLAEDIEMSSKIDGKKPPRTIYIVIDNTPLPNDIERNRIAVMAKGKKFETVCDEIYRNIFRLPHVTPNINLDEWSGYVF